MSSVQLEKPFVRWFKINTLRMRLRRLRMNGYDPEMKP
jgi:hypothetical protein